MFYEFGPGKWWIYLTLQNVFLHCGNIYLEHIEYFVNKSSVIYLFCKCGVLLTAAGLNKVVRGTFNNLMTGTPD